MRPVKLYVDGIEISSFVEDFETPSNADATKKEKLSGKATIEMDLPLNLQNCKHNRYARRIQWLEAIRCCRASGHKLTPNNIAKFKNQILVNNFIAGLNYLLGE